MMLLYFACTECKIYTDAGDRWAYWKLEQTGVVNHTDPVNVHAVLQAEEYWNPSDDELSAVRDFLNAHEAHRIVFGTKEEFAPNYDDYEFEWMEVGDVHQPRIRYLFEILHLETWEQVTEYMSAVDPKPAWWYDTWSETPSLHEKAKRKFAELVAAKPPTS